MQITLVLTLETSIYCLYHLWQQGESILFLVFFSTHLSPYHVYFSFDIIYMPLSVLIPLPLHPIASLSFSHSTFETLKLNLINRNNLTVLDWIAVQGQGARGEFTLNSKRPGSHSTLLFELKRNHLADCQSKSFNLNVAQHRRSSQEVQVILLYRLRDCLMQTGEKNWENIVYFGPPQKPSFQM